ncbi:monocyte chemotactic protein 1B-like [Salminus brasiliensis]|uniref:monocyte chemotactic protein 1B-like n=1 Tax=Salminus brasiliensis TaxID=930266 RepID=UPI003B830014
MRTLSALLVLLLLGSLQLTCRGTANIDAVTQECCPKVTTIKPPVARIVSYRNTNSNCAQKAVMFKMISGNTFCVEPTLSWVAGHMKAVDKRKTASSTARSNTSSKP